MEQQLAAIGALISITISAYVAISNRRTQKAAAEVQAAATAINAYSALCASLQAERQALLGRLECVEKELADERARRPQLEARIEQLEQERDALMRRIAELEHERPARP